MERLHGAPRRKMRGSMLIVAMGILALMSIMAITFARLMKLESDASTNYLDMIRAKLLAESGLSRSSVGLRESTTGNSYDSITDTWVFTNKDGSLAAGTQIEDAEKSSFEGDLGGTYADRGNIYKVKVIDCASQVNLNGMQPRLPDMFDNLGTAIAKSKGVADPVAGLAYMGATAGNAIIAFRGALVDAKYSSKMQLLELFQESERSSGTTDADKVGLDKFNSFKDYVTANSWINEKTVKGNANPDPKIPMGYSPEMRAPVNVNTAAREVLIACLQGLAGRGRYVGTVVTTQGIDEDDPDYPHGSGENEEKALDEIIDFVWVEPLTEGQAEQIATLIENRRLNRAFQSYADFEYFVDTTIPAGVLPPYKASLHPTDDRNIAHFKAWYTQAARDMLKANFNPNARPAYFNPSVSARLVVDKANLCKKDKDNNIIDTYTTEFCFSSMGYFEITSLGQVLDTRREVVAESKVRTVIKLFDLIMHTSQKEFELAADDDKLDIISHPENVVAFDAPGHEQIGYIALYPVEPDPVTGQGFAVGNVSAKLANLLVVKFDQEKYDKTDELSIANGEAGNAMAPPPDTLLLDKDYGSNIECDQMPKDSDVLPDGFYVSKFKKSGGNKTRLRYRAASPAPGGNSRTGTNQGEVNIPMYTGGLEFWVKPEFDSTEKVFASYLSVTCYGKRTCGPNGATDSPRDYKGGTQMFLFKNTDGALRITRLYYESFCDSAGKLFPPLKPFPGDFDPQDQDCFPPYEADRPYTPQPPATPPPTYPVGRPLPDDVDKLPPKHARIDVVVDHDTWGGWKAGEWHHVLITWDDNAFENDMSQKNCCLRLFIDGRYMPGVVYQYAAARSVMLNELDPGDCMFVGGIHREQKYAPKGLFKFGGLNKFATVANATIDNFVTYNQNNLTVDTTSPPHRYPASGVYINYITIPFPPGVDKVRLRAVEIAAYAPAKFAVGPTGLSKPVNLLTSVTNKIAGSELASGKAPGVSVRLFPAGNPGLTITPGTELQRDPATATARVGYEVTLEALSPQGHAAPLVSPVFDSIQVSYFLPREEVILFEKVIE